MPVLAGVAIREAFPATAERLDGLCTLSASALMLLVCGSYVAHSASALLLAWPRLLASVCVLHAGALWCSESCLD